MCRMSSAQFEIENHFTIDTSATINNGNNNKRKEESVYHRKRAPSFCNQRSEDRFEGGEHAINRDTEKMIHVNRNIQSF